MDVKGGMEMNPGFYALIYGLSWAVIGYLFGSTKKK